MKFNYIDTQERDYPDLGVHAVPGNSYDLPGDPSDGRWQAPTGAEVSPDSAAPVAPTEPTEPEVTQ